MFTSQSMIGGVFTQFDMTSAVGASLDYVQLVGLRYDVDPVPLYNGYGFITYGRTTLPADMPTTGSASFAGKTVGAYRQAGATTSRNTNVIGDIAMTANFGTGAVTGAATNFRNTEATPTVFPLDFSFTAAIQSGTPLFQGNAATTNSAGPSLTGVVQGGFYGAAGAGPDEAGLVYQLGAANGNAAGLVGGAVLQRNPPVGPVLSPLSQPPAPPSTATCVDAACVTGSAQFYGPSVFYGERNTGIVAPIPTGTGINNASSNLSVTVSPGATAAVTDDTYVISFKPLGIDQTLSFPGQASIGPQPTTGTLAGFPFARRTLDANIRGTWDLYDLSSALSGSLDYVQLASLGYTIDSGGRIFSGNAFITYGKTTLPADMPATGSATFAGTTLGSYRNASVSPATSSSVLGDVTMTASFGTGGINGAATNFRTTAATPQSLPLEFGFNASIASGTPLFQGLASTTNAGGPAMSGTVQGSFFGPAGSAPREAGFVYKLEGAGLNASSLVGAAVLGRQP